jgi:hypothetical protein
LLTSVDYIVKKSDKLKFISIPLNLASLDFFLFQTLKIFSEKKYFKYSNDKLINDCFKEHEKDYSSDDIIKLEYCLFKYIKFQEKKLKVKINLT